MSANGPGRAAMLHDTYSASKPSRIGQGRSSAGSSLSGDSSVPKPSRGQQQLLTTGQQRAGSAVPRFMQPTSASKQSAVTPVAGKQPKSSAPTTATAAPAQLSTPPQSGHLACTPVLNISAKPSPAESGSSSSKWKSTSGSGPVFSVITRGSRQPTKQPPQPMKPHSTAARSRPTSAAKTPEASNKSLSLRSSSNASSTLTTPSTFGSSGSSSSASTPAQSRKLAGGQSCSNSNSSCCSTRDRPTTEGSIPTGPPRSKDCQSLVRVLGFDFAAAEENTLSSTQLNADKPSGLKSLPSSSCIPAPCSTATSTSFSGQSRIPAAPGISIAGAATRRAPSVQLKAASTACMHGTSCSAGPAGGHTLHSVGELEENSLELLNQQASIEDSSSTTWLSDGSSSEEALQQLAGDACLPAAEALAGLRAVASSGSNEVAYHSDPSDADAATNVQASGAASTAAALQQHQQGEQLRGSCAAAGGASQAEAVAAVQKVGATGGGRSTAVLGCVMVLGSVLLLVLGFLAAGMIMLLGVQEHEQASHDDVLVFSEAFNEGYAVPARHFAM